MQGTPYTLAFAVYQTRSGETIVHEHSRYRGQTDAGGSITGDGPIWVCTGAWVFIWLDVGLY